MDFRAFSLVKVMPFPILAITLETDICDRSSGSSGELFYDLTFVN
jgi:hypothetical protein